MKDHRSRPGVHPGKHMTSRGSCQEKSCDAGALWMEVRNSKGVAGAGAVWGGTW